jgi:NAD(P)-dependent dehydrogenase (short-subunit alcohol dehydrogenase family)
MSSLKGKIAIVTGGASGMGRATAILLSQRGARVTVADIAGERAETVAAGIRASGGEAIAVTAFGGVDILHNNAGDVGEKFRMDTAVRVTDLDVALWDHMINVNLRGPMLGCKWAIPEMLKRGGGAIVNTSSSASLKGQETAFAYGVSKGGLNTLTQYVATSFGPEGIRCNAIVPGLTVSPELQPQLQPASLQPLIDNILTPYYGRSEDIAYLVAFLVSDEARYITGQCVSIDGGMSAHAPWYSDARRKAGDA